MMGMKKIIVIILACTLIFMFAACSSSKDNKTGNTVASESMSGYESRGDMLVISKIDENADYSYWKEILDAVNEYRDSSQFAADDLKTRGEKTEAILADFEGKYILEDSVKYDDTGSVTGLTVDGASFKIGIHDPEWYSNHH